MPTAILMYDDDDDGEEEQACGESSFPTSSSTVEQKHETMPSSKEPEKAPTPTVPSVSSSKASTTSKAATTVTPKAKTSAKPTASNSKKTAKKRPASAMRPKQSSATNNSATVKKTKTTKKLVAGQMTLGAFFGGGGATTTKNLSSSCSPQRQQDELPLSSAVSAEKLAQLKSIVLGSSSSSSRLLKTPQPMTHGVRRVSPHETPPRSNAEHTEHDDDKDEGPDNDSPTADATAVDTPLVKETHPEDNENDSRSTTSPLDNTAGDDDRTVIADATDDDDRAPSLCPTTPPQPDRGMEKNESEVNSETDCPTEPTQEPNSSRSVARPVASPTKGDVKFQDGAKASKQSSTQDTACNGTEAKTKSSGSTTQAQELELSGTDASMNVSAFPTTEKMLESEKKEDMDIDSVVEEPRLDSKSNTNIQEESNEENTVCNDDETNDHESKENDTPDSNTDNATTESALASNLTQPSQEVDEQHAKLQSLYDTYYPQAVTLFASCREGLAVDSIPPLSRTLPDEVPAGVDAAKARLATLIEGRSESLAALAQDVAPQLTEHFATVDDVTEEIKLLAKRQPLVKDHVHMVLEDGAKPKASPDIFQDESPDRFWQWQVTVVDLLPNKSIVKQRRAKIRKQVQYLHNLVAVIQTLKQLLQSKGQGDSKSLLAKLSRQEEKVLQYQREQAKLALEQQLKESQRQEKEKAKAAKKEAEAAKKKEAAAAKAESKKKEVAAKKEAAAAAKREAKAKEAQEKARIEEQKQQKKQAQLSRQKNAMMTFLQKAAPPPKKAEQQTEAEKPVVAPAAIARKECTEEFDVESFRSQINTCQHNDVVPFRSPSEMARRSRRRLSRPVQLSVYVTVEPENAFGPRAYAELQQVTVRNRHKFLSFHEDVRPPYHGTWSKKSLAVNPRNPFKKDRQFFDYDYDSEAEWEEGDNEIGEDIANAADDEDEKEEDEADGEDDGWLAADDDLDDDPDEETKLLRQKLVHQERKAFERPPSIIAPLRGRPFSPENTDEVNPRVEGMSTNEAFQLLSAHHDAIVADVELYLDPFPPALIEEGATPSSPPENQESLVANMQTFLRFVHHNSTGSKEKLIEDLRTQHPDAMSSRAQAMRTLEQVAEKQKHPIKGFIWEVKKEILEQHDLEELMEENKEADPEAAKQQVLRTIAGHIHNSSHTSKEKLVHELHSTHASILSSRAETMRHVEALAEKKKLSDGSVTWEVKPSAQRDLGIELESDKPVDNKDLLCEDQWNEISEIEPVTKKRKLSQDPDRQEDK